MHAEAPGCSCNPSDSTAAWMAFGNINITAGIVSKQIVVTANYASMHLKNTACSEFIGRHTASWPSHCFELCHGNCNQLLFIAKVTVQLGQ